MTVTQHQSPPTSKKNERTLNPVSNNVEHTMQASRLFIAEASLNQPTDIDSVKQRYEQEKEKFPASIAVLRDIYSQLDTLDLSNTLIKQELANDLGGFTNRALLAYDAYQELIADETSPTSKNTARYSELLELVDQYEKAPLIASVDQVVASSWVKDNPEVVKPFATEAFAIACIMTLDANNKIPSFMQNNDSSS